MPDSGNELGDIYDRYAADVYRFAFWLCGDRAEAEDITSETFVRVLTSAEPVRTATVKGYLFTIARHYFIETRRREAHHVALGDSLPDERPRPDSRAEQQ